MTLHNDEVCGCADEEADLIAQTGHSEIRDLLMKRICKCSQSPADTPREASFPWMSTNLCPRNQIKGQAKKSVGRMPWH